MAVRPEELRAIRRASSDRRDRAGVYERELRTAFAEPPGSCLCRLRARALVFIKPRPPTGATSRRGPPRGAFLIPRPLAEVGYCHAHSWRPLFSSPFA